MCEADHAGGYNVEAAAQGDLEHKSRLAPPSNKTTDIITEGVGGRTVESQVKFYNEAKNTTSALSESRYTERDVDKIAPSEQIEEIRRIANDRANRNRNSNPERSRNNEHTARKTKDHISHPDKPGIKSVPLSRKESEDMTKAARQGQQVEYPNSKQKQAHLQKIQYANAAKAGAIGGAVYSAASEVIRLLQRRDDLSQEDLEQALKNVLIGAAKGAGGGLLITGVQHAGRVMSEKAAGAAWPPQSAGLSARVTLRRLWPL